MSALVMTVMMATLVVGPFALGGVLILVALAIAAGSRALASRLAQPAHVP